MKKIIGFALLFLLGTLAYGQCLPPVVGGVPKTIGPGSAPDYFNCANWATSPLPLRSCSNLSATPCYGDLECALLTDATGAPAVCSGPIVSGGIPKFVDPLPGLGVPAGTVGPVTTGGDPLGKYIPVAVADIATYPGSDYYEIGLFEYFETLHSSLPPTKLRGYIQLNNGTNTACLPVNGGPGCTTADNTVAPNAFPHYLGPTILSQRDRPVRILFRNMLPANDAGGSLFVPVDTTYMGSGMAPDMGGMIEMDMGVTTDGARNPMCGRIPKPAGCFTENRATLHLHGGITPWISDGTPHQWITPAAETRAYPDATLLPGKTKNEGVSVFNVPDMPDPGKGAQTFFYTNQQSARLMFYHDHAWGITRLNVYAGEAAPYVVTDATEQALMAPGGPLDGLGYGIPLVIQDKTFVPPPEQLATEDPTWDATRWGGFGSVWVPHVYMPAQNPGDVTGVNGFGRWFYSSWFWPPSTPFFPPINNPYFDPACDANVSGWCEPPLIPGTPNLSSGMEAFNDTPLVNGTAYPTFTLPTAGEYRFRILNAANDRFFNLQWYVADPTGKEVALDASLVAAAQLDPNVFPTPDTTISPAGPAWIQIGTEGGFLPAPVVILNQVMTWVTDPTRFDWGNGDKHSLLLAPAERADVVVDFGPYAGKTLILYNDAPAAFPARVASYDYYTGAPDQTDAGGAPSTQPGFGPNTRTIMQVVVPGAAGSPAPNLYNTARLAALQAAWAHHLDPVTGAPAGVFESSLDPIIVAQGAYNSAYGITFNRLPPRDGYARIADMSMTFNTLLTGNSSTNTMTMAFQNKGLHDETNAAVFDDYGRMSANLGLEAPGATPLTQNIILYPYINPPTEFIAGIELPTGSLKVDPISSNADGTQIWKLTHNGVDTHPIHFHLFNVQLLNRITWDNRILPPDANELGWKDTVRVSPLEDTIVALRPIVPKIPFGVPDSVRPLDPSNPIGSTHGFNSTDTLGNPISPVLSNVPTNFGWEYVWHCHILGHEEMDMMRPINTFVSRAFPLAPSVGYTRDTAVNLTWTDGTLVDYTTPANWGSPSNEIGYQIQRAAVAKNGKPGAYSVVGSALANQTTFSDTTAVATSTYSYRVVAFNAAGATTSAPITVLPGSITSMTVSTTSLTFGNQLVGTTSAGQKVTLTNTGNTTIQFSSITWSANFFDAQNCTPSLAPGNSCTINVRFQPALAATGPQSGLLTITDSVPGSPQTVSLTGTGTIPILGVLPTSLVFNSPLNVTSGAQTVTVSNTGTAPLVINSITDSTNQFAHTTTCKTGAANALAPLTGSCTVSVTFRPTTATTPKAATLNVNVAAPATSGAVVLTGNVTVPTFTVSPASLAFGNWSVAGGNSPAQTVTVTNTGAAPLVISSVPLGGANPGQFSRTNACPGTLAVGAPPCTITVRFNPTSAGAKSATLTVNVAAPAVTKPPVTLSGTGN